MPYPLLRELINLAEKFEQESPEKKNVNDFLDWLCLKTTNSLASSDKEPDWEGKSNGRSPESVINSSIVHLFRYAKFYSKIAIANSPFTTVDEVIFLVNLLHNGSMTKIQLISMNVHEKSTGIQIINRLIQNGFIRETINPEDKRSRVIEITDLGKTALDNNMDKIRKTSRIVVGDLNHDEKMQLIRLLQKLETFHVEQVKKEINFEEF